MDRIVVGFYLKPHVWIGEKNDGDNPKELAFKEIQFLPNVDIGIQKQGLVFVSIDTCEIPSYQDRSASNVLRSETASFVLDLFNAFSFAFYEAQLKKFEGSFQSIPQEVHLEDLFIWIKDDYDSIDAINSDQPMPIEIGEYKSMVETISRMTRTAGYLNEHDFKFRWEIEIEIFKKYLNKQLLSVELRKFIALINRGIVSIRGASFDSALLNFWSVIETITNEMWVHFLRNKGIQKKRIDFLTGREFTSAIVLENLNLHGLISNNLYKDLKLIRQCRNRLLHRLQSATPEICYKGYEAVKDVLRIHHSLDLMHRGTFYMGNVNFKYDA